MENPGASNRNPQSDEIDLGQLFQMINNGFKRLFKRFLGLFVYLKKNAIKLGILAFAGLVTGFGLNQIVTKKQKTEVIVKPNLESRNYLYGVITEIEANLEAKDTTFFGPMGIDKADLQGFKIMIEPIEENAKEEKTDDELKYLEILEKFRNDDLITGILRTEIFNKSTLNHRITFLYKDAEKGSDIAQKLIEYINSNDYFKELVAINQENANERIKQNQNLIGQIDNLVSRYSEEISEGGADGGGRIVFDTQEKSEIFSLLNLKNNLIKDIERKKLEMQGQKEAIQIINFGKSHEVQESFFGKSIVFIPLILISVFVLIDLLKYFNRKASEMQLQ